MTVNLKNINELKTPLKSVNEPDTGELSSSARKKDDQPKTVSFTPIPLKVMPSIQVQNVSSEVEHV